MDYLKNIVNFIKKLSSRHSEWEVFSDFIEMSAISISNPVDIQHRDEREKRYLEIAKSYERNELEVFPKILGELIMALGDSLSDVLGEVFNKLNLACSWKGQFFTPINVCRAMAEMVFAGAKNIIDEKGFISVCEPCCGAGTMIIGLAQAMKASGYNYQKQMIVTAVDIDIKSVHMAYIQLGLLGIPAVILHGDSLKNEEYSRWYTPMYFFDCWSSRMNDAIKINQISKAANQSMGIDSEKDKIIANIPKNKENEPKYEQLSIFDIAV